MGQLFVLFMCILSQRIQRGITLKSLALRNVCPCKSLVKPGEERLMPAVLLGGHGLCQRPSLPVALCRQTLHCNVQDQIVPGFIGESAAYKVTSPGFCARPSPDFYQYSCAEAKRFLLQRKLFAFCFFYVNVQKSILFILKFCFMLRLQQISPLTFGSLFKSNVLCHPFPFLIEDILWHLNVCFIKIHGVLSGWLTYNLFSCLLIMKY